METTTVNSRYLELKAKALDETKDLQGKPLIQVGAATCGVAAGALAVKEAIEEVLLEKNLEAHVVEVGCLGHCYAEPMVVVAKPGLTPLCYGNVEPELARRLVKEVLMNDDPCYEFALAALEPNDEFPTFPDYPRGVYEQKMILEHCGFIDPENINQYIAQDGYAALAKALTMTPEEVILEITTAKLRGRGGAGFPAGLKWQSGRKALGDEKFVICNGDEGDPGAFMDRSILESNPHQVLEGLALCAYAVGAQKGIFYIRAEYPRAIQKVKKAIEQAREKGLLGDSVLGSTFRFEVEVFEGSGAFVCGESSALVSSMEGGMGIPRHRPPRLSVSGYQGKPTIINNVKTLCYAPLILNRGAEWFTSMGSEECPGTAVFTLVGKVTNTGLVEVPMGTTLRQLIYDVGEGIPGDKLFKAVQIGGPSGGCLPESVLDTPIDFDSLKEAGAIMGSGGLVVLDEDDCMVSVARYFLEFTQKESCGKCTLCRLGTRHMLGILEDITAGRGTMESLTILRELAEDVAAGSLCNLGKTAPNPVLTTLRYFRHEYEAHIMEKRCPACRCKELILYYIEPAKCTKLCNVCVGSCPTEAIFTREDGVKVIDQEKCVKCDNCLKACPPEQDAVVKLSPPVLPVEKGGASG